MYMVLAESDASHNPPADIEANHYHYLPEKEAGHHPAADKEASHYLSLFLTRNLRHYSPAAPEALPLLLLGLGLPPLKGLQASRPLERGGLPPSCPLCHLLQLLCQAGHTCVCVCVFESSRSSCLHHIKVDMP